MHRATREDLILERFEFGGRSYYTFWVQGVGADLYAVVPDGEDELILQFETTDLSCKVTHKDGEWGELHFEKGEWIFYHGPLRTRTHTSHYFLDHAQVLVAKNYLASLSTIESEGGHID